MKTRKAIIVLTDGLIVGETISTKAFSDMIVEGDALIYPVMFGANPNLFALKKDQNSLSVGETLVQQARQSLSTIASRTGGRLLIATRQTDFDSAFKSIGDELRKQYLIGFLPSPEATKKGGRVSIALSDPTWNVRSKSLIRLKLPGESPKP